MINKLNEYYDKGLLTKQTHPNLPLFIWNYTPKVQIDKLWDDITLQCRGLVTDTDGNIVARPFKKFFNFSEHELSDIPNEPCRFFEKVDGSLGILFNYNDQWIFASRGSFTSDYAIKGQEILDRCVGLSGYKPYNDLLSKDHTFLFEIIFPEGRIVVDYGNVEKLVLLGAFHTESGLELIYDDLVSVANMISVDVIKEYHDISHYNTAKDTIKDDEEGRVALFENGFRMKIKGEEYVRLHYIITNFSSRKIWDIAKFGHNIDDYLVDVPDEFYVWAKETYADLQNKFKIIKADVESDYWELIDRKEYALKIKNNKHKHLLFTRLGSHSHKLNDMIWDMLYPEYFNPFSNKSITKE